VKQQYFLIPGSQNLAIGFLMGSLINLFVWTAITNNLNYGNLPGFFDITSNQYGITGLLLAF